MTRNSERAILIRQRSSAEGCAIAALFSAIIIIIGIFLGFQTNWWVFLASLAAAVVVGIFVAVKKSFAGTEAFEQQCREHSVSSVRDVPVPNWLATLLVVTRGPKGGNLWRSDTRSSTGRGPCRGRDNSYTVGNRREPSGHPPV